MFQTNSVKENDACSKQRTPLFSAVPDQCACPSCHLLKGLARLAYMMACLHLHISCLAIPGARCYQSRR